MSPDVVRFNTNDDENGGKKGEKTEKEKRPSERNKTQHKSGK